MDSTFTLVKNLSQPSWDQNVDEGRMPFLTASELLLHHLKAKNLLQTYNKLLILLANKPGSVSSPALISLGVILLLEKCA